MTIPVCVYYRYSDDKQQPSIARQRSQVEPHAASKGYVIVEEYIDENIPGGEWDLARRVAFGRLRADAARPGCKWKGILCDDKDRFGRFDSLTNGEVVGPLRRAGIFLESVAQGRIDWETFKGRITDAILAEVKRMEAEDTSRRVLTQFLQRAREGKPTGGRPGYGYRKDWSVEPRQADVLRLMFRLIDEGGTVRTIQETLYRRGVASPAGLARWSRHSILLKLKDPQYTGCYRRSWQSNGKYHRAKKGQVHVTQRDDVRQGTNPPEDWIIVPDHHEAIIDRDLFDRVQARIRGNKGRTTPEPGAGEWLLPKLLVCAECGCTMYGRRNLGGRKTYVCSGHTRYGAGRCGLNTVYEDVVVGAILDAMKREFLNQERLDSLRQEIRAQEEAEREPAALDSLRREVAQLDSNIASGRRNLALLPEDMLPGVIAQVREWEAERTHLAAEWDRVLNRSRVDELEQQIQHIEAYLWHLDEVIGLGEPAAVREALRGLVVRVELNFLPREQRKKGKSPLTGGVIVVQDGQDTHLELPECGTLQVCAGLRLPFTVQAA